MTALPAAWTLALKALADAKASDALLARAVREAAGVGAASSVTSTVPSPASLPAAVAPLHKPPATADSEWKVLNWTKPGGARSSVRLSKKDWEEACKRAAADNQAPMDWLQKTATQLHDAGSRVGPALATLLSTPVSR